MMELHNMDSDLTDQWPEPKRLKTLAFNVAQSEGNNLLHQLVLDNSDPNSLSSDIYLNAVLLSMAGSSVDVNALNDEGYSPLHLAVLKNNVAMVKKLLSCLAHIDLNTISDFDTNEYTALHLAAELGHLSIVRELLINGADVDVKHWSGRTALCFAARKGNLDVIELLVSKGADVNVMAELGTPLHYAADKGKVEAVKLLVSYGAALDVISVCQNLSMLHFAAQSGNIATVEYLVSNGADPNAVDECGLTPLCHAAKLGNFDFLKQLLDICEKYNIKIQSYSKSFFSAAQSLDFKTIEFFILKGANINVRDDIIGRTPLHLACKTLNKLDVVELLLKNGSDVHAIDICGNTSLHLAVKHRNLECTQLLLEYGANVNAAAGRHRYTPLHSAVGSSRDCVKIVKLLLDKGANRNSKTADGSTALDLARYNKYKLCRNALRKYKC